MSSVTMVLPYLEEFRDIVSDHAALGGASLLLCAVCYATFSGRMKSGSRKHPPGPTRLPLIGNLHQLPTDYQNKVFAQWAQTYGDVIYVRMFRTPMIILNTIEAAQDLMVKRSTIYSGRRHSVMFSELLGFSYSTSLLPYGDQFRRHRKWMHEAFQTKSSLLNFRPMQRREVNNLVIGLTDSPQSFEVNIRRFTVASIMEPLYGHIVTSMDDKYVQIIEQANIGSAESGGRSLLVDFFPILKYFGFKRRTAAVRELVRQLHDKPYELVVENMASGSALPSFTASLLEQLGGERGISPEDAANLKGAAATLYSGAGVTTTSVLLAFLLAMTVYPDVQKKAQQELDTVVGPNRLPDFEDRDTLPYLECVLKELYRWSCPVPLGLPHRATADDEYRGYHIAQGTVITANIWSMTRNEQVYPEPETFRPERFEETAADELKDPCNLVFGFGRRICPGQQFADANIWLAMAHILATFDVLKARDADGHEITPVPVFTSGFSSQPGPFECDIVPRARYA